MIRLDDENGFRAFYDQMMQLFKHNVFGKGRSVQYSEDEQLALVEVSDENGNRCCALTSAADLRAYENQKAEIASENQKIVNVELHSMSGLLPQSEDVFCLGAYGEGNITKPSFIEPEFEGGQLFILGIRSRNIDFAIKDTVIENVGIPTTLFIIHTKRVVKAKEYGDVSFDVSKSVLQIDRVYVSCIDTTGVIDKDTPIYHYPYTNVNRSSFGHVCLGSYSGSDELCFSDSVDLYRFAYEFFYLLRDSHEYSTMYKSSKETPLIKFLKSLQNKKFPSDELIATGYTYDTWINKVVKHIYGK